MAGIRFEKVSKSFKDVRVITDLDLEIKDGEFFTFVGPSGCGKSTILNMIAGLEPVSAGKIYFDDRLMNPLSPRERDVAMVFQNYALYPHLTVRQNIAFPLTMKKVEKSEIQREVKRTAGLLGLEGLLHRKPKELSGGQRQRVALGRAIVRQPRVFLMDEPLSNLDARLRVEMRAELKRLHQELKITTIYVTHDQAEALSLSERVAVLLDGRVQQCSTPADVYRRPANIFVAGFIGSPPINLIPARVLKASPLEVECNGIRISPHAERAPCQDKVVIGIRPDDIAISSEAGEDDIEVTISLVEPAGSFNWVDAKWNGVEIKGAAGLETSLRPGEKAGMRFAAGHFLVFEKESGERL
jgi:multiple sugar transport system ATP-binding protein